jgi:hypothetical protein
MIDDMIDYLTDSKLLFLIEYRMPNASVQWKSLKSSREDACVLPEPYIPYRLQKSYGRIFPIYLVYFWLPYVFMLINFPKSQTQNG